MTTCPHCELAKKWGGWVSMDPKDYCKTHRPEKVRELKKLNILREDYPEQET